MKDAGELLPGGRELFHPPSQAHPVDAQGNSQQEGDYPKDHDQEVQDSCGTDNEEDSRDKRESMPRAMRL